MVKPPISLPFISGLKGKNHEIDEGDFTNSLSNPPEYPPETIYSKRPELHFIAIEDLVDVDDLIKTAQQGHQVFVNLKGLIHATDKYFKFIHRLQQDAIKSKLQLHQISQELLLLVIQTQEIQVRTLKKMAQPIDHDELLPKSMAGY